MKHIDQRVALFIDTQNLYHTARSLYGRRVNFENVLKESVAGRKLIRARAYVVTTENEDEKNFHEALQKQGIELKSKELQVFAGGSKKADWDVGLAIDAVASAPKVDVVIIASGDGDFIPLVEYLQYTHGCQVEVISFGRSTSAKLKEAVDRFEDMDAHPETFILGGYGNRPVSRATPEPRPLAAKKQAPLKTSQRAPAGKDAVATKPRFAPRGRGRGRTPAAPSRYPIILADGSNPADASNEPVA